MPLAEGEMFAIRMKVRVPNPKKKGDVIEATAALDTMNKNVVTAKMLEKWGYKPAGNAFALPELFISGNQIGSKMAKVILLFRVPNLKFDVVEPCGPMARISSFVRGHAR